MKLLVDSQSSRNLLIPSGTRRLPSETLCTMYHLLQSWTEWCGKRGSPRE